MNLFDRFILTIYSLALIVISLFTIGLFVGLIPLGFVQEPLVNLYGNPMSALPYLIVAVIFLVISVRFFIGSFVFGRPAKQERGIRQRGEFGDVNISIATIQTIAERAARRVKGVRDLKTIVKSLESGNLIELRVSVDGETPIPEITQKLQADVKATIEAIAGVEITEVRVTVAEVLTQENLPLRTRRIE